MQRLMIFNFVFSSLELRLPRFLLSLATLLDKRTSNDTAVSALVACGSLVSAKRPWQAVHRTAIAMVLLQELYHHADLRARSPTHLTCALIAIATGEILGIVDASARKLRISSRLPDGEERQTSQHR